MAGGLNNLFLFACKAFGRKIGARDEDFDHWGQWRYREDGPRLKSPPYAPYFTGYNDEIEGKSIGHGLGLELDEPPILTKENSLKLIRYKVSAF